MGTRRRLGWGGLLVCLAIVAAGCGSGSSSKSSGKPSLTIGAFDFTESPILANIYKGALEASGYKVTVRPSLGSREVVEPALERGELSLYPGYAATDLEFFNKAAGEASADLSVTVAKLRERLPKTLTALEPAPAIDVNTFAVTHATADRLHLAKLSDLTPVAGQLVLGGPGECPKRPFCAQGLERVYGIKFKGFTPVGLGVVADNALENGDVQVTLVLSTDGLARSKFVLLEDDKHLQNADNVIPIVRTAVASDEVKSILNRVSAMLTTEDLARLNTRVDVDKEDADAVARSWLKDHGFSK